MIKYGRALRRISSFSTALLLPKSFMEKELSHTTNKFNGPHLFSFSSGSPVSMFLHVVLGLLLLELAIGDREWWSANTRELKYRLKA